MSVSNGLVSAPVGLYEVAQLLGCSVLDVGSVCTADNINKYALHKPVDSDSVNPTAKDLWYLGKNQDFNLEIKGKDYGTKPDIVYRKITDYYALLFFDGYQHNACALGFTSGSSEIKEGETATIYACHSSYLLTIWDILKYHKDYKNGKLKVVIAFQSELPCNYYVPENDTYVLADGYVTVPSSRGQVSAKIPSVRGVGTYTCYMTIDTGSDSNPQYFNMFVGGYSNCFFSHSIVCKITNQLIFPLYDSEMGFFYDVKNAAWVSGLNLSPTTTNTLEFVSGSMPRITGFLFSGFIDSGLTGGKYVAVWEWNTSNLTYNFNRQAVSQIRKFSQSSNSYPSLWSFNTSSVTPNDDVVMGVPLSALPYLVDSNGYAMFVHFYIGAIYDSEPSVVKRISPIWALRIKQTASTTGPDLWEKNL